jgi:HAD superfamily hydrolase (TIGR01509 family)
MTDVLERLRALAVPLALVSNNTQFWFQRQWQKLALDRYFIPRRAIISRRTGAKNGAEAAMFKAAIDSLGLKPVECVFVDDQPENIQHALEFGLGAVLFPSHAEYGAKYIAGVLERMSVL